MCMPTMGLLGRCSRGVFNLLPLRGRKRRLVKLLVLLLLSAGLSVAVMSGPCVLGTGSCGEEEGEGNIKFEIAKDYVSFHLYTEHT